MSLLLIISIMLLCNIDFAYDDETFIRHFVENCPLAEAGIYAQKIANKSCVSQVFINIHSSDGPFFEYTL